MIERILLHYAADAVVRILVQYGTTVDARCIFLQSASIEGNLDSKFSPTSWRHSQ